MSGEFLFHKLGLRKDLTFVEESVKAQGRKFDAWGMFTEGPMAYDHFPRMWAADLIASGYDGPRAGGADRSPPPRRDDGPVHAVPHWRAPHRRPQRATTSGTKLSRPSPTRSTPPNP